MRLTVLPRRDDPGFAPLSAVFQAPGGTLGRSADNHLALPDSERGICRVQAALRISDGACYLVNLSGMGSVSVNGRAITRDQEVPLAPGDELAIGPYTLRAEDPAAPVAAATLAAGAAAAAAAQAAPPEPDPLLDSPLLEGVDLMPPDTHTIHQSASSAPAAPAPETPVAPEPAAAPEPMATPASAPAPAASAPAPAPQVSDSRRVSDTELDPTSAGQPPAAPQPAARMPDTEPAHGGFSAAPDTPAAAAAFPSAPAQFDAPFGDLDPPRAAEPQAPQSNPADVFSDLFGPGTLPVGSVPDVSAHPFDLESAQTRNPEDPLRQLPRGDANVRGPLRDPLDMLGNPDADDANSVFSDQTPSTLPSHDPLDPHRSDPVTDTLSPRPRDDDARAARDHLREYGGYLRPARVRPQDAPDTDSGKPPHK
ncbi:FHA domain-containing protein [Bordetella petrii]|uniref:FHA domain-containing protein n=1 Tax=Bordetella petrii TaxID=94624 RepID=UPI001F6111E5|nr:FHA domain-containing protein [Bordetella petrii]